MQATRSVRRQKDRNVIPPESPHVQDKDDSGCPIDEFTLSHMRAQTPDDE